jgi:subtilisin-like proprotein convertase family protein
LAVAFGVLPAVAGADEQLPNLDRRGAEVTQAVEAVEAAPADGLLTGPSSASPESIALGYVRAHETTFGLDAADVGQLVLEARSVSPDGITHLRYDQVLDGIESYDSGLTAHVTRDGRLIEVTGKAVPGASLDTTSAAVGATASLGAARDAVHGSGLAPGLTTSSRGSADFTTGETARLRWTDTGGEGPRLAWSVVADGTGANAYNVLVDAGSGDVLARTSITDDLGEARYYVDNPDYAGQAALTMPPAYFDDNNGGTRLWGDFARTYADFSSADPAAGTEGGAPLTQIPASGTSAGGPDWLYATAAVAAGTPCPASGCTWNSADPTTETTNLREAATNAHILVSRYHDHLAAPPIGFDEASGNFQRVNTSGSGVGGDYVQVEVDDSAGAAVRHFNNANFATPPDGTPGRMQMYLWNTYDVNGADDASIVYHEYGHGMTGRLLTDPGGGSGLTGLQSQMMGEAWSDFYALDYLQTQGYVTDTSAPGEVTLARYVVGGQGLRAKPIDCPVDPSGATPACDGHAAGHSAVAGGYTYGDIAHTDNTSPHNGGEVWAETLWDLRARLGSTTALTLVTGGLRLSPVNPTMLDMRDAILREAVAIRSAPGAADDDYDDVWSVFAARGFGVDASTTGANSTAVVESYAPPTGLKATTGTATFSDPYPGGDDDGVPEAGETVQVGEPLTGVAIGDESGTTGTLSAVSGGGSVVGATASWPLLGYGRVGVNTTPMTVRLPSTCATPAVFSLTATAPGPDGGSVTTPIAIDTRPGSQTPVPIHDNATATSSFVAYGPGAIGDADIRIGALQHTFLGDLTIRVRHDGVTATLFNAKNDNNDAWNAQDLDNVVFDDQAGGALPENDTGDPAPSPSAGHYRPDVAGALAAFDGHPVAGTWTLSVSDGATGDTGVLKSWGVESPQIACAPAEVPVPATAAADGVSQTGATLHGSVDPAGRATGLRFEYGTTGAYGSVTDVQDVGAGVGAVAESAALSGLAPGTTYHARVDAIRENGVVAETGQDVTFTTAPVPVPAAPALRPAPDRTAPSFLARPKVRIARKASHRRRAATVAFALSETGKVRVVVARATRGVKSRSRCVARSARKKRGRACTFYRSYGRVVAATVKSTRSVVLKLGSLPKGRYTVSVTATDAAGNRGRPVTVRFTVR